MAFLTTLLELVGLALVVAGATLIYVPAGMIVAGVELVLLGIFLARPTTEVPPADRPGEIT